MEPLPVFRFTAQNVTVVSPPRSESSLNLGIGGIPIPLWTVPFHGMLAALHRMSFITLDSSTA